MTTQPGLAVPWTEFSCQYWLRPCGFHVYGEDFFVVGGEVGADVTAPVGDDGLAGPDDSRVDLVLVAACGRSSGR